MWSSVRPSSLLAALLAASTVSASVASRGLIAGRDAQLLDTYNYVIVGGGASGLTVADRLTENPNGAHSYPNSLRILNHNISTSYQSIAINLVSNSIYFL